ncbi:MAG: aldehyde dehydrogenase family protein [Deltaproteobacteria bacterium]|nr:aldehyde dehydrogenase family protein [Deltaproteobacteria bacterium]
MLRASWPYYLAGKPAQPNLDLEVTDKYSGKLAARVARPGPAAIELAIAAAAAAQGPMRRLAAYERQGVLEHCVRRFRERSEELALSLCIEAGKPIRDARGEVDRLIDTFRSAAEQSVRLCGEVLDLEISARARGYAGMYKRVPVGPCALITPFNFPLNLVAHKIAPALAVGCPFVLKPASSTPLGALIIGEILAETDLPEGAFSILPCQGAEAEVLATDERIKLLSFTGSPAVGWALKAKSGRKKVVLELGGNAACVLDEGTDLDDAIGRLIFGAFYQSGQSCISVQRILIHESIYEQARERLVAAARALCMGDPREEKTFIGPMISEADAVREQSWIDEAATAGARLLCGGGRRGPMVEATLLESVPHGCRLYAREVFGPVACIEPFTDFEQALEEVNASTYGLQAGVFTRDLHKALRAWEVLDVGGVIVGDVPSWRVDHMPYGGVKESGLGREGIRWAMEDMTEIRLLVVRTPPGS